MSYTTINKSTDYFNTITYTGSGTSTAYTIGFPTDFVWIKKKDTEVTDHYLFNKISGVEKTLYSNLSNAEETNAGTVTSFDGNGFTSGNSGATNQNGHGYVSWNWLANGGVPVINTNGSISSTVSASTTSGFSIVSWTGDGSASATVGHGLGVAPKMIILKKRNALDTWYVMNTNLSSNNNVFLNSTAAQNNVSTYTAGLISTSPTPSVFSFVNGSTVDNVNASGGTYIAYCFAEKTGYSKFGKYTGNGSTDGTFVYTGHKPAFVMFKRTDSTSGWGMYDNKRTPSNLINNRLLANTSGVQDISADNGIDFLSNGFKWRTASGWNASGGSYIYMAFAEAPLVGTNGVTAKGR